MPPTYEALPQEGDESFRDGPSSSATAYHIPVKPETYYGEGPFDPPSSDDESEELIDKEDARSGRAIEEEGHLIVGSQKVRGVDHCARLYVERCVKKRPASIRYLVIALVTLVSVAVIIGIFAAKSYTGTAFRVHGVRHITLDHIFNGTFSVHSRSILWVPEAGDGVFATVEGAAVSLVDLKSNSTKQLVSLTDVKDENGRPLAWADWKLSSDMKYVLVKADYKKQWRHSSFGNYYIHEFATKRTWPLIPPTNPPVTAYAAWSPTGQSIAYVTENDLYVVPSASNTGAAIRVTTSGNASLFHGVPDWVYEEEVFSSDYALWWAPDASKVAFLRFDETTVDEYTYPVYNPTDDAHKVVPYPDHVVMKYPKPGYDNPLVSVHVFQLDVYLDNSRELGSGANATEVASSATIELKWTGRQTPNNSIISEVAWVSNDALLVKEVTRSAEDGSIVYFDLGQQASHIGSVVRKLGKDGEQGDAGWIDSIQEIYPLAPALSPDGAPAYLDIVPTPEGYNHIALFSPANSSSPRFLTSGTWEVTSGILAVDANRSLVYFQAANPSSIQRHIYAVPLPKITDTEQADIQALTDTSAAGYYDASFSPEGAFYLLSYRGPQAPWQRIVQVADEGMITSSNPQLNDTLAQYELPIVKHSTIESDGYELNVVELRPPRMDDSGRTKYPVLFRVYGGPGSQMVDVKYGHDWHTYAAAELQYVVVVVDGRGTGFRGRALRNPVKNRLGAWETVDQVNAAKIWAAKEYVDPKRIGIWGWSYGGFMSSKVIEADAGVHSLAMAVAPVTSWKLYDSIYTERYMNLPAANPDGYVTASVSNVTGFRHADYLLAHGSGDDNVHFANSAHMLDMLTAEKVRGFRFRMFTDSDHGISRRGANRELYEFMTEFLLEKWGKGGKKRGW
ncbi:dipeptidyl aminopeptidase [Trametes elegans]|nr:dipeptidyl aminopeptidase [Trametes elegans]